MKKRRFVSLPPGPTGGITQRLAQRGAEFVDRVVEVEFRVGVDVLLHRSGEGAEKVTVVRARKLQVIGMIEGEHARGEILRVMPAAGLRTRFVDAAPAFLEQRADDVARGVLEDREGQDLFRMRVQAIEQRGEFVCREMAVDVPRKPENLVSEDLDTQGTADRATGPAIQSDLLLLDDLFVQRIERDVGTGHSIIEIPRGERFGDVGDELLGGVCGHSPAG